MQLTLKSKKIWMYHEATDFRKSINGLSELVCTFLPDELYKGIFVFFNRQRDKLKILAWHGNGFILLYKRVEQGKFTIVNNADSHFSIDETQLSWLVAGLDWHKMSQWKTLGYDEIM